MRKGIVTVLALVVAMSVSAAGTSEAGSAGQETQIVFQHWMTELKPIFDPVIERFEADNPGVTVQQEILPYGDYWSKLPIAIAGGQGPDLYAMTRPEFEPYAAAGRAMDIESAIEASGAMQASMAALDDEVIDIYRYNGALLGVPFTVESSAIYFNKTMFEEAGLPLPSEIEDTWTWDDMRDLARALTREENGRTVQYGMHVTPNRLPVFDFIWSNGGELYSEDGKTILAGSPEAVQAMEFLTSLIVEDRVSPDYALARTVGSWEQFMSGTIGMIAGGPAVMSRLRAITDFEWDVAEFPLSPYSGTRRVASNVLGFIVGPDSDAVPQTIDLIAAFTGEDPMNEMARIGANIPEPVQYFV
jgi:multiple sugar transport system substrate-binding protein